MNDDKNIETGTEESVSEPKVGYSYITQSGYDAISDRVDRLMQMPFVGDE